MMKKTVLKTNNLSIKVHNDLLERNMKFTAMEKDLFFFLCSVLKERGSDTFVMNISNIKKAIKKQTMPNKDVAKVMDSMSDKLMSAVRYEDSKTIKKFVFFNEFEINKETYDFYVSVNPKYAFLLNDLLSNYTSSDFKTYLDLKTKYMKDLYFLLLRWKYTGCVIIGYDELRFKLNIPDGYRQNDILNKVLMPSMEGLSSIFQNLRVEEIQNIKKVGRPTTERYCFRFEPLKKSELFEETVYVCPDCGGNLIMREMNGQWVYCHKDGAYDDASCHKIIKEDEMERLLEEGKTKKIKVLTDHALNEF